MQRAWVASPEYRSVITVLRSVRSGAGVSQRELARRLGKPPSFINKIELMERRVDILEFIAISSALGLDSSDLIKRVVASLPQTIKL